MTRFRPYVEGAAAGELSITIDEGGVSVPQTVAMKGLGLRRTSAACEVAVICPGSMTVTPNSTVTLQPTTMAPGTLTCSWSAVTRPATSHGTFSAPSSCTGTDYFADVVGTHLVQFDVSDGLGGSGQCTTPITVTTKGDLWIELTWDRNNDMDLHLLHPNGTAWFASPWDCSYLLQNPDWGAGMASNPSLDRDDRYVRGPENIRINVPVPGIDYKIGVHNYLWRARPNSISSTVKVYCGGNLVTTRTRSVVREKDIWVVGTIRFGTGSTCAFTSIDTIEQLP